MKRSQFAITSSTMTYRKLGPSWNLGLVRQGWTTPLSGALNMACSCMAKAMQDKPSGFLPDFQILSEHSVPNLAHLGIL